MLEENDLKRNGSGYYDPTAYKALKNYENEVENSMEILRGEVWEIELVNGNLKTALVVSAEGRKNDRWISILLMNEEAKGSNIVQIKADALMYADCDRISFAESHKFNKFIRKATASEMKLVDQGLMIALGLNAPEPVEPIENVMIEEMKLKLEEKQCQIVEMKAYIEKMQSKANYALEDMKILVERDFYKQQYEMLLERMIAR